MGGPAPFAFEAPPSSPNTPVASRHIGLGYGVPNLLIEHAMVNPPIPPWFWRGVNNNQNALHLECFMDELAHAAGQDPRASPDIESVAGCLRQECRWWVVG
jgi:CO/xanthine dehydrogenase Mo-binding subunit